MKLWLIQSIHGLILIILILTLISCTTAPVGAYLPPYPISEVKSAERFVRSVTDVPWIMIRKYGAVNKEGDIRLWKGLGENREDIMIHEISHLYEYYVLGIDWEDTKNHLGWPI